MATGIPASVASWNTGRYWSPMSGKLTITSAPCAITDWKSASGSPGLLEKTLALL